MTLSELKAQIDEMVNWVESDGSTATAVHVFILGRDGRRTEDIELKFTLGMPGRVYIDPK